MRKYGAKERAFMAAVFSAQLSLSVLGVLSARSLAEAAVLLAALFLLSAAFCIDAARGVIPAVIPVALSALSLAAALFACGPLPGERLFGFCFGFGISALVREAWRLRHKEEGLGAGDVKLFGAVGLMTGGQMPLVLLLSCLFAGIAHVVLQQRRLPFAPAIALAAACALLCASLF